MKAEKKLSIKVKSKTERRIMEDPELEMITEWNIKNIFIRTYRFHPGNYLTRLLFQHDG